MVTTSWRVRAGLLAAHEGRSVGRSFFHGHTAAARQGQEMHLLPGASRLERQASLPACPGGPALRTAPKADCWQSSYKVTMLSQPTMRTGRPGWKPLYRRVECRCTKWWHTEAWLTCALCSSSPVLQSQTCPQTLPTQTASLDRSPAPHISTRGPFSTCLGWQQLANGERGNETAIATHYSQALGHQQAVSLEIVVLPVWVVHD